MTLDWHTDDYPELRDGPPWVMEEMIRAQAALVDGLAGSDAAAVVGAAAAAALAAGEDVDVVGCGTSEHAAMAIVELVRDGLAPSPRVGRRIRARQALDAALDPPSDGLVIGVSHDGGTRATRLALEEARRAGALTAAITARPGSDVAGAADHVVVTPAVDRSWCHTVAYTSAILAGAAIARAVSRREWWPSARAALEAALDDAGAREAGRRLHPAQRIVAAGMGSDAGNARELALKIEEGARIPATAHHLETLLHGHLAGCDPASTRIVLLAGHHRAAGRQHRRLALAARAAAEIGLPTTAIGSPEVLALLPDTVDAVALPLGDDEAHDPLPRALATAVAVQWLTLGLVDAAGTNPDLIRREQAPWRAAATVADEGSDW